MYLQAYIYKCENCNYEFKINQLPGQSYGEFLMRSETGKKAFLSAINDLVFDEVSAIVESNSLLKKYNEDDRITIFQNVFRAACDLAEDGSQYEIYPKHTCPDCHSQNLSYEEKYPLELVDEIFGPITHSYWNSLDAEHKEKIIHTEIEKYLCEFDATQG